MSEPTVYIIDDDPSVRRGVTRLLRAAGMTTESFASARDFLVSGRCAGPGCIIVDIRMPDMTGPELQEELALAENCMPLIFLSAHGDVPTAAHAMKKGAVDFLTKPVDRKELLKAVHTSLARDAANRAQWTEKNSIHERIKRLTPREREVMTYVIAGRLNKKIAYELGVSEETVKIHRGRVMQKLGVGSVAELVRICGKVNIAPADSGR